MSKRITAPALFRWALLAWLTAALAELLLLPKEIRGLEGLESLAGMSFTRLILLAGGLFVLLTVLALFVDTAKAERWGILAVFAALAACALISSFTWPFLAACGLILVLMLV